MRLRLLQSLFMGFFLTTVCIHPCFAQELEVRHFEKEGGFSYQPPNGWKVIEIPGFKFKGIFGPPVDKFSPNINFVDEAFSGNVQDYAEANLKTLQTIFKGFQKLSQTKFTTNVGQTGVKLVTNAEQSGKMLRQTYYFFDGPNGRKLVATCSTLAKNGEGFDKIFDETLKTLILEK